MATKKKAPAKKASSKKTSAKKTVGAKQFTASSITGAFTFDQTGTLVITGAGATPGSSPIKKMVSVRKNGSTTILSLTD